MSYKGKLFTFLLLLGGLQSCFYSSPVPLASEKANLPESLDGHWQQIIKENSESTEVFSVELGLPTTAEGYNSEITLSDSGKIEVAPSIIRSTTIDDIELWEIGINDTEKETLEYYFATPKVENDNLIELMFVQDELFKIDGSTRQYLNSDSLQVAFEALIHQPYFFDSTEVWVFKKVEP